MSVVDLEVIEKAEHAKTARTHHENLIRFLFVGLAGDFHAQGCAPYRAHNRKQDGPVAITGRYVSLLKCTYVQYIYRCSRTGFSTTEYKELVVLIDDAVAIDPFC